ncbi:PAS domain S-box-containing protein [Halorientalis persicus]|uniref:PAS domain S-box-containing protein n=1 Tax=Halorientalis persicus TaxID=1367881 RepID=A0A1H8CTI5_9EURY|nr:bacterio-opsin activator domain-containing protein [Halorientalis persicus]SEM97638.1 PAS domain S-box-containing protein [Halorientalis persicus]
MEVTESIARAALDTLSSQIAVLDEEGHILFTNSSWGTAGDGTTGAEADAKGLNYFDSVDPTEDDHAVEAVRGIRRVLDGECEEFTLEYPCHTPEQQRWFLMRATPFTIGDGNFATVAHIDITDRRLAELEAQANARQAQRERQNLEHLVDRINGLVQDITRLLVESVSRDEIEHGVCERLADTDPYLFAWIGSAGISEERLRVRASAGPADVDLDLDDAAFALDADAPTPSARAFATGRGQIVSTVDGGSAVGRRYGDAGIEAVISVPIGNQESEYGVLTVCAGHPDAFDEREQVVLEALGRAIANAIDALESKRTLTADRIVEMEFTVDDPTLLLNAASIELDCRFSYSGSVYGSNGALREFYTVDGCDPATVREFATDQDAVTDVTVLADHDDGCLLQLTLSGSLVGLLVDRGAVTREVTSEDGVTAFTVELSREADARALFEDVADRYEGTELAGYHEHERPVQTRQEFRAGLEERLTDRQLTALRTAYYSGFFDWPRAVDGDELAAMMDISRSTFHQHLRVAERKLLDSFFERDRQ